MQKFFKASIQDGSPGKYNAVETNSLAEPVF